MLSKDGRWSSLWVFRIPCAQCSARACCLLTWINRRAAAGELVRPTPNRGCWYRRDRPLCCLSKLPWRLAPEILSFGLWSGDVLEQICRFGISGDLDAFVTAPRGDLPDIFVVAVPALIKDPDQTGAFRRLENEHGAGADTI